MVIFAYHAAYFMKLKLSNDLTIFLFTLYMYTSLLKIGTPKNREFREILPFSKTCDFLKIRNFEELRRFPKHAIS